MTGGSHIRKSTHLVLRNYSHGILSSWYAERGTVLELPYVIGPIVGHHESGSVSFFHGN